MPVVHWERSNFSDLTTARQSTDIPMLELSIGDRTLAMETAGEGIVKATIQVEAIARSPHLNPTVKS